jgi:hypothetical protein
MYFPCFLSFKDSTEQQIPRPVDKRRRTIYYLGKKKEHTAKIQLMVNKNGIILHETGYKKGSMHDYDTYKEDRPTTPKQVVNVVDLEYLGLKKTLQGNYLH